MDDDPDLTERRDDRPTLDVLEHASRVLAALRALTDGRPGRDVDLRTAPDSAGFASDLLVDAAVLLGRYARSCDVDPGDFLALAVHRADQPADDPRWDLTERLTRATDRAYASRALPAAAADDGSVNPAAVRAVANQLLGSAAFQPPADADGLTHARLITDGGEPPVSYAQRADVYALRSADHGWPVVPDPPAGETLPVDRPVGMFACPHCHVGVGASERGTYVCDEHGAVNPDVWTGGRWVRADLR